MLKLMIISVIYIYSTICTSSQQTNNVQQSIEFYQKTFVNKTLNLVTSQLLSDLPLKSSVLNNSLANVTQDHDYNYLRDTLKQNLGKVQVVSENESLEVDLSSRLKTQRLPFNMENSYFNVSYIVANATFDYLKMKNGTQVLKVPLTNRDSDLWILLPPGPSTRKSLIAQMKQLNNSVIERIRRKMKPAVVHIEIPIFRIKSLYLESNDTGSMPTVKHFKVNLETKNTTIYSNDKDEDADKWFEANKPFIFIMFANNNKNIRLIGHFCNPGNESQVPKNQLRDIGYW